jgi:hypothetical protein
MVRDHSPRTRSNLVARTCRILALVATLFIATESSAQNPNLVRNPGFESFANIPDLPGDFGMNLAQDPSRYNKPWVLDWVSGNEATPDYFHAAATWKCANDQTTPYCGVPKNYIGIETALPANTSAYAGIWVADRFDGSTPPRRFPSWREYLLGSFTEPLTVGKRYRVSMDVSLAEGAYRYLNSGLAIAIGNYTQRQLAQGSGGFALTLQGITPDIIAGPINQKVGWVKVEGEITGGGEMNILIGVFQDALDEAIADPPYTRCPPETTEEDGPYYYIDNVEVVEIPLCDCKPTPGTDGYIEFRVERASGTGGCCYDVYAKNTSGCRTIIDGVVVDLPYSIVNSSGSNVTIIGGDVNGTMSQHTGTPGHPWRIVFDETDGSSEIDAYEELRLGRICFTEPIPSGFTANVTAVHDMGNRYLPNMLFTHCSWQEFELDGCPELCCASVSITAVSASAGGIMTAPGAMWDIKLTRSGNAICGIASTSLSISGSGAGVMSQTGAGETSGAFNNTLIGRVRIIEQNVGVHTGTVTVALKDAAGNVVCTKTVTVVFDSTPIVD